MEDATEILKHRQSTEYETWIEPGPGVRARYWNAGHILGSASIEVEVEDARQDDHASSFPAISGPDEKVFYKIPDAPSGFDYILCEVDLWRPRPRRLHARSAPRGAQDRDQRCAGKRGGNLVIPAFAVERSQELLHDIGVLIKSGEISPQPRLSRQPAREQGHHRLQEICRHVRRRRAQRQRTVQRSALPHRRSGR